MTIRNAFEQYVKTLSAVYDKAEAESITRLLFQERAGFSQVEIMMRGDEPMSEVKANDLTWKLLRLMKGEPVQYVLGFCYWYGMKMNVNRHVLIPRPETEELVEWITSDHQLKTGLKVFDIGTGSGCIAIALMKHLPDAEVKAIDISREALKVAMENAELNAVSVHFFQGDILAPDMLESSPVDIIVSNPPYIPESEKGTLHKNVIGYEPSEALFVPDNDPLIYYHSILKFSGKNLKSGGELYLEINPLLTEQLILEITTAGFMKAEVKTDLSGKPRMIRAIR